MSSLTSEEANLLAATDEVETAYSLDTEARADRLTEIHEQYGPAVYAQAVVIVLGLDF